MMQEVTINKQARLSQHLTSSSVAALGHSSELDGSRLSPHFTLGELCKTSVKTADMKQLLRYTVILLDIADEGREAFDELLIERNSKGTYWLHFAVRPKDNRMKIRLIQT